MSSVEILSPPFRLTWTFMCSAGFSGMGSAAMFGPYELIPSGETSSYRSNPLGLAEFTLSRRDPAYVGKTKAVDALEIAREKGEDVTEKAPELKEVFKVINTIPGQENVKPQETEIGSTIYANKPGDGSAREQAASCQRVIGALANITQDYATKRYRSNVMNWGMLPFHIKAYVIKDGKATGISLYCKPMTENEREIVEAGCLINVKPHTNKFACFHCRFRRRTE